MTNIFKSSFVALFLIVVLVPSCDLFKPGKNSRRGDGSRYVYVHGDVNQLISGTTLNQTSFIEENALEDFSNFTLFGISYFESTTQFTPREKDSQSDIEDRNSTDTRAQVRDFDNYQFSRLDTPTNGFDFTYKDSVNDDLSLFFKSTDSRLELKAMKLSSSNLPLEISEVLHYSVDPDKTKFRFLFRVKNAPSDNLITITFVKNKSPVAILEKVSSAYQYLFGSGERVRWSDSIEVTLCGEAILREEEARRAEIMEWTQSGKLAGRDLVVNVEPNPAPFSDVNQHCIFEVEDYLFEDDPYSGMVLGITLPIVNSSSSEIVDADIFIASSTFKKIGQKDGVESARELKMSTYKHEFGHFLGLGHEFTKDKNGVAVYPSIMSYDDVLEVQKHDYEALDALYSR